MTARELCREAEDLLGEAVCLLRCSGAQARGMESGWKLEDFVGGGGSWKDFLVKM